MEEMDCQVVAILGCQPPAQIAHTKKTRWKCLHRALRSAMWANCTHELLERVLPGEHYRANSESHSRQTTAVTGRVRAPTGQLNVNRRTPAMGKRRSSPSCGEASGMLPHTRERHSASCAILSLIVALTRKRTHTATKE